LRTGDRAANHRSARHDMTPARNQDTPQESRSDVDALCTVLLQAGLVDRRQVDAVLADHPRDAQVVLESLFDSVGIAPDLLIGAFSPEVARFGGVLDGLALNHELVTRLPSGLARQHRAIPIHQLGAIVAVAVTDVLDPPAVASLEEALERKIRCVRCRPSDVDAAIEYHYGAQDRSEPAALEARGSRTLQLARAGRMLAEVHTLPPLPDTVVRMREAMESPDVAINRIVDLITLDPPVAAKVLSVANSAAYGFTQRVEDITLAVSLLGMREVYSIVLSSAVADVVGGMKNVEFHTYWLEAVMGAMATRIVIRTSGRPHLPGAFAAGLLRDVGRAALWQLFPDAYAKIDNHLRGAALIEAEADAFGFSHCEAGFTLAEYWSLPPTIAWPIRHHHDPDMAEDRRALVDVVAVADALCAARGFDLAENLNVLTTHRGALARLGIDDESAEAMLERFLAKCEAAVNEAFDR